MAEKISCRFPVMYEILKYYGYWDEAISLLNGMWVATRYMAEANEHALVSNLSKRTIEISSSKQLIKYATERLQQFKVQFIMSNDFDRNHLFKFIKHFDVMFQKYEEERLAKTFSKKLALHKKDNSNEIGDRKFLNVDYIFQNTKAVISVEKIAEVLKMHDPEYIKNAYYKLQIIDEDELKRRTDSRYYYRSGIRNNIITMQNLFENLQNGAKNDQFKPIVDFIAMYSDLDSIVQSLPRIKSKVIAMAVYDYYEGQYNPRAGVMQRGQYVRVGQQAVNAQQPQVEKSDEDSIAKGIRKNKVLQEYLQFLEMRNSLDSEFIETMFKDLTIAPMANLREFVTFVKNYNEFHKLLNLFKLDKIDNFKSIFPKLDWFGISFDYENSHSHINYKVMPNKDYVKVTAQNYILLYHNLGSKTYVYKIYCADKWEIYASLFHNKYKPELATLNLIQYLNFKPTLIEKLDPEEYKTEFMPEEQTVQYQEKFGLRTVSFTKAYSSRVSANHVGSQIQIEVEFENITHIEVRRILRLELDQTLRTVIDAKSENRDISFSLVYNTTKISGHEHVPDLIRLLTDNKNIIDEFNLVNIKSYLDSKKFIEGVLINNKKIRKFTYPKSIKPTHLAALEKIFKTLEKCSIRITDEILDLVIT